MILAKCCHDMDILVWLSDSGCSRVSSFGELSWFKEENAPKGAAKRCMSGCGAKEDCPYDAEKSISQIKVPEFAMEQDGRQIHL